MRTLYCTILLFVPALCLGQKAIKQTAPSHPIDLQQTRASFAPVYVGTAPGAVQKLVNSLRHNRPELRPVYTIASQAGTHYTYQQYYNNVKVYRGRIKVNVDHGGTVRSVFDNTASIESTLATDFPANEVAVNALGKIEPVSFFTERVYFNHEGTLQPCLRLEVVENPDSYYEVIVDKAGKAIYRKDLAYHYCPPADSTVTALIFNPDPLTTANVVYGSPYNDNGDADITELNNERVPVNMTADFNAGTFSLSSNYVLITEHSDPVVNPVTSTTPDFSFTRSNDGFEDVNVYYHINNYQQHIQNLGFTNLVNYQIHADAHGFNGADNSQFNPGYTPPRLTFGEGGVDDGEDADVIIHEYGHAISYSAAQGTNSGVARQTLDEANGDYFAASYSRFVDPYKWENVFSWDGHNEFWPGRSTVSNKHYPEHVVGNIYNDADIWSSTIMQIWEDIGRDETDRLLMESMYSYAVNMSMANAAWLYVQADSALNNGANYTEICARFLARGLVTTCDLTDCLPVADFAVAIDGKKVSFIDSSQFALNYDWDFGDDYTSNEISPEHTYLSPGFYSVQLKVENQCGSDSITKTLEIVPEEENIQLLNSHNFALFHKDATIDFGPPTDATIYIYDVHGKLTWVREPWQERKVNIQAVDFTNGMYFIRVVTSKNTVVFKLLKL